MAESGYLAVDIFFVLSGFVLADAYGRKLVTGELSPAEFAVKRLRRFYPLYLAGLILGLVKVVSQHATGSENALDVSTTFSAIIPALLFLPAIGPGFPNIAPLNVPGWSLLYEFWINVVWASIARRFGIPVQLITLLLAGVVFATCTIIVGNANLGPTANGVVGGIARTIFSFTAGLLIHRTRPVVRRSGVMLPLFMLFAVFCLLFVEATPAWRVSYDLTVALFVSPLLVFGAARIDPVPAVRPFFAWLGTISFPLYAIHAPLIAMGIFAVRKMHLMPALGGIALLSGMLMAAWLASFMDNWLQRRMQRQPPGA